MTSGGTSQSGKAISDAYFANGCIVNAHGVPDLPPNPAAINQSAVFDALRRWSQWVRIISRLEFAGYAVEGGKSILWFRRHAHYTNQDLFEGIADAIASTAPSGGLTNRWLLDVDLIPYSPSLSTIWKPSAFADYWGLFERCTFGSYDVGGDAAMLWHGALGLKSGTENLMSEYPTGYRYARLDNPSPYANDYINEGASANFYKSCRLYEPPVEVESSETVEEFGDTWVKLTLTSRLWNTEGETGGAPSSISRDTSGWDAATIAAEPFRTPENGLRLYLLNQSTAYNPAAIAGDRAYNSSLPTNAPYAAIYPRFYLTRMVPEPRVDQNSTQDLHDTPLWSDAMAYAETVLRAICEGYIDTAKTAEDVCEYYAAHGNTMPSVWRHTGYTWENLCNEAFGGRWVTLGPTEATAHTTAAETRPEGPQSFGPIPNQRATAEQFNQLAAIVDLLTRVRVMLPYELQVAHDYYTGSALISAGSVIGCGGYSIHYGRPPAAGTASGSVPMTPLVGYIHATSQAQLDWNGSNWVHESYKDIASWQFAAKSSDALHAIPSAWSDMLDSYLGGIFHRYEALWLVPVTDPGGGSCSIGSEYAISETEECVYLSPNAEGTLAPPALPSGWIYDDGVSNGGTNSEILLVPLAVEQEPILTVPLVDVTRT